MMRTSQSSKPVRNDNRLLSRVVFLMMAATVTITVAFGIYYYLDRYIHLGDKTPVELGIEQLEVVVAESPEDPDARLNLAQHYFENGNYSDAIQQAEQVLSVYPDDPEALFLLGVAYTESGQLNAAVKSLELLAELRSEADMAHVDQFLQATLYYLGVNYVKLSQLDQAIEVLLGALEINHNDADALYQLGLAYSSNGDHKEALEAYEKAVRLVPDFAEAYQGMAIDYDALEMSSHARYARGMSSFSVGNYGQARQELELAARELPEFTHVHLGLALTYEQQGESQLAEASALRVLELEPNDMNANFILGRLQSTQNGN